MATPAVSPIQKRYTAGSCTLDVVLQPSALSQWYPQPIVQDLQFKLWVQPTEQPVNQSRGVAMLPRLIAQGDRATFQEISQYLSQKVHSELAIAHLSQTAPPPPTPPPSLQLAQPLSYLQLCDLTIVVRQCEQADRMLPAAIALASPVTEAVSNLATVAASNRQSATSNVISFAAAVRRRPKLWASSAAAALLAVGLTTAVWQNSRNNSSFTTATAPSELGLSAPDAKPLPNTALPKDAVELPESTAPTQAEVPAQNVTPAPVPPQFEAITPNVEAAPLEPSTQPPAAQSPATQSPAAQSPAMVQREPAPPQEAADAVPEVISAAVPEAIPEGVPEAPPMEPLPAQTEAIAQLPEATAPSPHSDEMEDDVSDRELDSADRVNQRVLSRAARQASPIPDAPLPSDISDVPDERAIRSSLSPTDEMIVQAQPYFQRQWDGVDVTLTEALLYTMRVSARGEVIEFEAEGALAEAYRDRLQPEELVVDMTQEGLEAIANLTFRVEVMSNGQVQVTRMP